MKEKIYKINDTVTLKTLENLKKKSKTFDGNGLHLENGFYICKSMYEFLGGTFKIIRTSVYINANGKNTLYYNLDKGSRWYWTADCFEEKQLELDFS